MPRPATQEKFAIEVGVSQPDISKLVAKGILTRGAPIKQWRLEYARNLRFQAAQHKSEDGIDRVKEAALLDRTKRRQLQIDLDIQKRELISCKEVAQVIASPLTIIRTKLLGFSSWLRSVMPQMTPRESAQIDDKIREMLTELSHERLPPDLRRITEQYFSDLDAAAEANGDGMGGPVSDT